MHEAEGEAGEDDRPSDSGADERHDHQARPDVLCPAGKFVALKRDPVHDGLYGSVDDLCEESHEDSVDHDGAFAP